LNCLYLHFNLIIVDLDLIFNHQWYLSFFKANNFSLYNLDIFFENQKWFSKKIIDLPINLQTKYIKFINTESLGSSLNLDNQNLDFIPIYDEIINKRKLKYKF
jgi:hypothetical protein